MTRDEIIEATRAFIRKEILEDEAAPLAPDEPLISAGIMTSFDLVSLSVFLETTFAVKVPDSKVSREYLDTLEQIATLVLSLGSPGAETSATDAARADLAGRWLVPSFRNRPVVVIAAVLLLAFLVDRGVGALLTRERIGALIEPARMSYGIPSYARALVHHELARPKQPGEVRIVFQGDSGTYGSYLDASEACPAVMGRELAAAIDSRVRVYNTSLFGQTFVKDAAMLEAELAYQPDLVVISLSSGYLDRNLQENWWLRAPTTIVYNRPLFTRFLDATPGARERPALIALDDVLASSESRFGFRWKHRLEAISCIAEHQTWLESHMGATIVPSWLNVLGSARGTFFDKHTCRYFRGKTHRDFLTEVPFQLDERVLAVLETIIDRARATAVEVVLFREPEPTLPGVVPARPLPWSPKSWVVIEEAIAEVAARKNVLRIDCRDLLPPEDYLDSERHWTVEGNEKIGRKLAAEIAPLVSRLAARKR